MKIEVPLENGLLPDRFGKFCAAADTREGCATRSFPITISDVPADAQSLALTFLDWDAIPVGGFCWIHWTACDLDPHVGLVPENASVEESVRMTQGRNSYWSPFGGGHTDPRVIFRYAGPKPPDATHEYTLSVFAVDRMLGLDEGFYLNELRRALRGHVIERVDVALPSRAR